MPVSATTSGMGPVPAARPQVLLVFMTRLAESVDLLSGISHYERTHQQWSAFLDDEGRAETDAQWLKKKHWQGVISRHTTPTLVRNCRKLGLPLVDLNDCPPFPGVPKIRPDNVAIGHVGAEHFVERGYRHFAFCGFRNEGWSKERRHGFTEALELSGHTCQVFDVAYPGGLTPFWDDSQIGVLGEWLKQLPKPVAVMACSDMRALQVLSAAQACGLLVPDEVAVLGANDDKVRCDLAYPPLSSVALNAFQSGYQAAELLDRLIRNERCGDVDQRIEPTGVIARRSTDALAIEDKNVAAALACIRERACHGLTVEEVLKKAFVSRSQLEKKFRRHLGRSPQAEIRRVQTERIRQLLVETDFPLKKIAELTGFEYVEYMCVVFKRLLGVSPGLYRKRNQKARRH